MSYLSCKLNPQQHQCHLQTLWLRHRTKKQSQADALTPGSACMHALIVQHHHTTSCANSQDKRHALQAAMRQCNVSHVLSFSSMFDPLRLSSASGSFSHLRASAGLQSSSTSVAVPTPPTILCLPCQSCNPVLTSVLNKRDPHRTELVSRHNVQQQPRLLQ